MELIDTHSHLYDKNDFGNDFDEIEKRLREAHVKQVFLPNIDRSSITDLLDFEQRDPEHYHPLMGLHPENIKEDYQNELKYILDEFDRHKYYGVGEVGMDLYWEDKYEKEQEICFTEQTAYSIEKGLPLIIHCRNAFKQTMKILEKFNSKQIRGIFHSFTGTLQEAEIIKRHGDFKLGVNGIITFKKSEKIREEIKKIPLKDIVLETDSPYLAPEPQRGKRNESSNIKYIAQELSKIKEKEIEEIAEQTTKNAKEIFSFVKNE